MQDAHIITGFAHQNQWLAAGVIVRAPAALVNAWVQAGHARIATPAPAVAQTPAKTQRKKP